MVKNTLFHPLQFMFNMIKLCCSLDSYTVFSSIEHDDCDIYGCLFDLSYECVNMETMKLINKSEELSFPKFCSLCSQNTKIEIIFNSNNSCEYCNFLFIITHLPNIDIVLFDTGQTIKLTVGELTTKQSRMIPINYLHKYRENIHLLSEKLRCHYQEEWSTIFSKESGVRYIEQHSLKVANVNYFDERIIKGDLWNLLNDYGLSEQWLLKRALILKKQR